MKQPAFYKQPARLEDNGIIYACAWHHDQEEVKRKLASIRKDHPDAPVSHGCCLDCLKRESKRIREGGRIREAV